jgi:hypothetical protein
MNTDKIENIGIIAAIAAGAYLLWKSGIFSGINGLLNGNVGKAAANIQLQSNNVAIGGTPITLGEVAVTSNPFTFAGNVITALTGGTPSGLPTLNLSATNNAFSKIGLTTAQVEKLESAYSVTTERQVQADLLSGNLSQSDLAMLYSVGWDGASGS